MGLRGLKQRPGRSRRAQAATLAAALAAIAAIAAIAPERADADRFYGLSLQHLLRADDVDELREAGVETVRINVPWPHIERQRGSYDWTVFDRQVELAGEAGVELLPIVLGTPGWLEPKTIRPPTSSKRGTKAWKRFLRALVARYGRGGSFIAAEPGRTPVKRWQIWNEPNIYGFWRPHPNPKAYGRMLRASVKPIRRADRRAAIVLGGLPPAKRGIQPDKFLNRLLKMRGMKRKFDIVAVHPYSVKLREVVPQVRRLHQVLARNGLKRKRMLVTEVGWGSEGYPHTSRQTEEGQAKGLLKVFKRFAAKRKAWRLEGVYWFTWRDLAGDPGPCYFCPSAGLLDVDGARKLSWYAFEHLTGRG